MRWWVGTGLIALYVLRLDFWWWNATERIAGLPLGLAYHLIFCGVVALFFGLVVRHAWPRELDRASEDVSRDEPVETGR